MSRWNDDYNLKMYVRNDGSGYAGFAIQELEEFLAKHGYSLSGESGSSSFSGLTDTPASIGAAGSVVTANGASDGLVFSVLSMSDISDAPPSYTVADAGKVIAVNASGDGYELVTNVGGGGDGGGHTTSFAELTDTPGSIAASDAGKFLQVNSGGTAIQFVESDASPNAFDTAVASTDFGEPDLPRVDYYVTTSGDDSTGIINTPASPFLTIQGVVDNAIKMTNGMFNGVIAVHLGTGNFPGHIDLGILTCNRFAIIGDRTDSEILSGAGSNSMLVKPSVGGLSAATAAAQVVTPVTYTKTTATPWKQWLLLNIGGNMIDATLPLCRAMTDCSNGTTVTTVASSETWTGAHLGEYTTSIGSNVSKIFVTSKNSQVVISTCELFGLGYDIENTLLAACWDNSQDLTQSKMRTSGSLEAGYLGYSSMPDIMGNNAQDSEVEINGNPFRVENTHLVRQRISCHMGEANIYDVVHGDSTGFATRGFGSGTCALTFRGGMDLYRMSVSGPYVTRGGDMIFRDDFDLCCWNTSVVFEIIGEGSASFLTSNCVRGDTTTSFIRSGTSNGIGGNWINATGAFKDGEYENTSTAGDEIEWGSSKANSAIGSTKSHDLAETDSSGTIIS